MFMRTIDTYQAHQQEHKAIAEGIKENGEEDTDRVIRAVMSSRHAQVIFKEALLLIHKVSERCHFPLPGKLLS